MDKPYKDYPFYSTNMSKNVSQFKKSGQLSFFQANCFSYERSESENRLEYGCICIFIRFYKIYLFLKYPLYGVGSVFKRLNAVVFQPLTEPCMEQLIQGIPKC